MVIHCEGFVGLLVLICFCCWLVGLGGIWSIYTHEKVYMYVYVWNFSTEPSNILFFQVSGRQKKPLLFLYPSLALGNLPSSTHCPTLIFFFFFLNLFPPQTAIYTQLQFAGKPQNKHMHSLKLRTSSVKWNKNMVCRYSLLFKYMTRSESVTKVVRLIIF